MRVVTKRYQKKMCESRKLFTIRRLVWLYNIEKKTKLSTAVPSPGLKFGGQAIWHHVGCFAQLRTELGWFDSAENLPGFKSLSKVELI